MIYGFRADCTILLAYINVLQFQNNPTTQNGKNKIVPKYLQFLLCIWFKWTVHGASMHSWSLCSKFKHTITFANVQLFFKSQYLQPRFSSQRGHIRYVQFVALQMSNLKPQSNKLSWVHRRPENFGRINARQSILGQKTFGTFQGISGVFPEISEHYKTIYFQFAFCIFHTENSMHL